MLDIVLHKLFKFKKIINFILIYRFFLNSSYYNIILFVYNYEIIKNN